MSKIVQVMVHSGKMLFTPLPQLHMQNVLLDSGICTQDEIVILEYENCADISRIFFDIIAHEPDIVTFSTYLWNFKVAQQLSRSLKDLYGDKCWIVWGGPHISEDPLFFVKRYERSVDLLVTWYGEAPIQHIISAWKNFNGALTAAKLSFVENRIKGVYFNAHVDENMSALEKESILKDQQKVNNFAIIDQERYNKFSGEIFGIRAGDFIPFNDVPQAYQIDRLPSTITDDISERIFLLESYRGCPFSCSYCLWGVAHKKCDYHTPERMIDEFKQLISWGARQFNFADAGFGLKKDRDLQFLKEVISCQTTLNDPINLSGYFFWQTLTDEALDVIEELVGMGVMGQLDIGIQTFNPIVTKVMKRPTNFEKFESTIERIRTRNIPFQMDLILGLPGDDFKGYLNSVKKVISFEPNKFQTFPLVILPGSDYDKRRDELGIKTLKGSRSLDIDTIVETASFSRIDIEKAFRIESYFYLTYTLRLLNKAFKGLAEELNISFYDVSMALFDWSSSNENIIWQLTSKYFNMLYEDRHQGRSNLDNFLFKNYGDVCDTLSEFIRQQLKGTDTERVERILELLNFDMLLFPKVYETIEMMDSFGDTPIEKLIKRRSVIARFKCKDVLAINGITCDDQDEYTLRFSERICNFREGGISTQYNFWKWNVELVTS